MTANFTDVVSKQQKNRNFRRYSPVICMFFGRFLPFWRKTGALALSQHVFFTNQQVADRGQQMQPVVVLGKTAIADFALAEDPCSLPCNSLSVGTMS